MTFKFPGVYPYLEASMDEKDVKVGEIARLLGVRYATVTDKMKGRRPITLEEAKRIRNKFFPEKSLDDLFERLPD